MTGQDADDAAAAGPTAGTVEPTAPFDRQLLAGDPVPAARALLGAGLVTARGLLRITEVEAYGGTADPASHAFRGRTARTSVMFGPPGHAYVYRSYGIHWCLNVVSGPDGTASAVLIRAGELVGDVDPRRARGPGRLTAATGVTGEDSGSDLCTTGPGLRLVRLAPRAGPGPAVLAGPRVVPLPGPGTGPEPVVLAGPRVGIRVATEVPWRFWLQGEPSVSAFRSGTRTPRAPTGGKRPQRCGVATTLAPGVPRGTSADE